MAGQDGPANGGEPREEAREQDRPVVQAPACRGDGLASGIAGSALHETHRNNARWRFPLPMDPENHANRYRHGFQHAGG